MFPVEKEVVAAVKVMDPTGGEKDISLGWTINFHVSSPSCLDLKNQADLSVRVYSV